MKILSKIFIVFLITVVVNACKRPCDKSLRVGEMVEIPIEFNGFTVSEIDGILVYRIDNADTNSIDTFFMSHILLFSSARSTNEAITDKSAAAQKHYGYFESYFDNATLIFDWYSGKDTLTNFVIRKSQKKIKGCHKNDPNVQIDKLNFTHKGKLISKGETIQINK